MSDQEDAIILEGVAKQYKLYATPAAQAIDMVGLGFLLSQGAARPFVALAETTFTVRRGERVGVIGRNGAGKSTLLRLVTGKTEPSSGRLEVRGRAQALMEVGVGFHDDFSGFDNIRAALVYGDVAPERLDDVIAEIVDFCELGEFIHEPLRKYSTGMRMRVFFAVATAIRPEILAIDEVLGVGDQYFAARSVQRLREIATGGCTLLLVSHSMQQVIDLCERAVWLERGRIVHEGPVLAVVKAYEEFIERLTDARRSAEGAGGVIQDEAIVEAILRQVLRSQKSVGAVPGGVSRWPSSGKLRVRDCWGAGAGGERGPVDAERPFEIVVDVERVDFNVRRFRACVVIFAADGNWITRIISDPVDLGTVAGSVVSTFVVDTCLLVPGPYVMSASLHEANEPFDLVSAERHDLVSRSFRLDVIGPAAGRGLTRLPFSWAVAREKVR